MISLVMGSYKRAKLLDACLDSILEYQYNFELEVVVVNDGIPDDTEEVCKRHRGTVPVKYIFSGKRNLDGECKPRMAGFSLNIGVQQCSGDYIVLSCAEIFHIGNCLTKIESARTDAKKLLVPALMYFDDIGSVTGRITDIPRRHYGDLMRSLVRDKAAVRMPYLMGMWRNCYCAIGGYDEDFLGWAGEDNDLVCRLLETGCSYQQLDMPIIHLHHGKRCDSQAHPENPRWAYNWKLFQDRKTQLVRNQGREWGTL